MLNWISRALARVRGAGVVDEAENYDVDDLLAEMASAPTGSVSAKLRKARRAATVAQPSQRLVRSTERLPPGQVLTENWPVLDIGRKPDIEKEAWRLEVVGAIDRPFELDWAQLSRLPPVERVTDIHCVTAWSRFDNRWSGISASTLVEMAGLSTARHVLLHGADGYVTNLELADVMHPDAMLVHSWNGEPLSREHGGPVRFMVPHLYLWKSAKWVNRIEFVEEDRPGFWEAGGYHRRGDPWLEQRFRWNSPEA